MSLKKRIEHIFYYYKWYILAGIFAIVTICTFANMIWEGHKPCRLRICAVLNTDSDCQDWFDTFTKELEANGSTGKIDLNQDQLFDYDNSYYSYYELEVMTKVSSQLIDVAICNEDMYTYLLALNACMPLDEALPDNLYKEVNDKGMTVESIANLQEDESGEIDENQGIEGIYAIELTGTSFDTTYDQTDTDEPLYAVIIRNTDHLTDSIALLNALVSK